MKQEDEKKLRESISKDNVERLKKAFAKKGKNEKYFVEAFEVLDELLEKINKISDDKKGSAISGFIRVMCIANLSVAEAVSVLEIAKLRIFNSVYKPFEEMAEKDFDKLEDEAGVIK